MTVSIDRSFEKDTDKIKEKKLLLKIAACIEKVQKSKSQKEISNLKKLSGFQDHYRIKIGDYRAGLRIEAGHVIFERLLHRKEIYRYYP